MPDTTAASASMTLTFLFTDIEGSTRLLQSLGEGYRAVLETHHRLLREAFSAHGGEVPRTEGDSFFVVFPSAVSAVTAAVEAQRAIASHPWPEDFPVRVRMGLHTGEASRGGDDYVGLDVHRAARIAAAGHGGQVLLSDTTHALVRESLPAGTTLRELGEYRLKDLGQPVRLFQADIDGLPTAFPPLKALSSLPSNLPIQATSFVGRAREIAQGRQLLDEARLLTLTGPGGTGKTRLSLQVAAEALDAFADGTYFVPLAAYTDPAMVPSAILQALGVVQSGSAPPRERLLEYVRDKELLLVLDNFEQVLDAGPLVAELLGEGSRLKAMVTSRAALQVYGEREMPIPPLGLPEGRLSDQDPQSLTQYEAVRLFIERARLVRPDFEVDNDNAPAVAAICVRLDGLPLAIELAAARVKVLPPHAILARLERSLAFLTGGARDLPGRQQTLRAAIAWSYDLLAPEQQSLFRRLGVFVGGAAWEHIEAVCGPAEEVGCDLLDGLTTLVNHSLVHQSDVHGEPRFTLLETIREYALERLEEHGEESAARQRHANLYVGLAERAAPELTGPRQKEWLDVLEREHDNLRAALDWSTRTDAAELGLRLAWALWRFWHMRGYLHEGRVRLAAVLKLPHAPAHPEALARGHEAAGGLAYWQGEMEAAQVEYEQALQLARRVGDPAGIANALYNAAFPLATRRTSPEVVRSLLDEALTLYRELGDAAGVAKVLWGLGTASVYADDTVNAVRYIDEAVEAFRPLDDRFGLAWALHMQGILAVRLGDADSARRTLSEALSLFADAQDVSGVVLVLDDFAQLSILEGEPARALRLAGAASALEATSGVELASVANEVLGQVRPGVQALDDEAAHAAWQQGRALSMAAAIAEALGELNVHVSA